MLTSSGGGYHCFNCGQWIPIGTYHFCSIYRPKYEFSYGDISTKESILKEIKDLLEELIRLEEMEIHRSGQY